MRAGVDPDDIVAQAWLVALRRLEDLVHDDGLSTLRLIAFLGTTILRIVNRRTGEAPNTVSHRYRRALAKLRQAPPESILEDPRLKPALTRRLHRILRRLRLPS